MGFPKATLWLREWDKKTVELPSSHLSTPKSTEDGELKL
jgi:hypothetical protein